MLHDNYTKSIPFFKGVIIKYFEKMNQQDAYKAFIEMPVNEHRCLTVVIVLLILRITDFKW